ncbi:response regulator transcription factor [Kitasatospora setae]|uniref:Putative two-component system response regulator n=2 Tax=Kitasatospora TaxID=2063 RepID=E4NIE1_KITSK|nr:putative two-component system response regulator [Kitasatospora setae KM-6054]
MAPMRYADTPWRVLVVDDEPDLVDVLCGALRYEGWQTRGVTGGLAAVAAAADWRPHAMVLDVMLPDFDGLEVLRRVHGTDPEVRVLLLTARDAVEDRIAGITAGGDDYVTKPFSLEEVVARLRGLLRRTAPPGPAAPGTLAVGDLRLDPATREARRGGEPVDLSPTEFALLRHLMEHPRQVLSKAQLLDAVWSYDFGGQAHVVELYISYLRRKIDAGRAPMIHTVRGAGYVLRAAAG